LVAVIKDWITETVNISEMISERINMVGIHSVTGLDTRWRNKILKLFEHAGLTDKRAQKDTCYLTH